MLGALTPIHLAMFPGAVTPNSTKLGSLELTQDP